MFAREAHRAVLEILGTLRADVLHRCRFLFGGGTRIVLQLGEYRESKDIDFLCSDPEGYADLRFADRIVIKPVKAAAEPLPHAEGVIHAED